MNIGKQICEILKSIRKEIAVSHNLDYKPSECDFEGDCAGFCEKCDAELRDLERQLKAKYHCEVGGFIYTEFNEEKVVTDYLPSNADDYIIKANLDFYVSEDYIPREESDFDNNLG